MNWPKWVGFDSTQPKPDALTQGNFPIYVIGTSISWGQGLRYEQKYAHLVAQKVHTELGWRPTVTTFAHSGARIYSPRPGARSQSMDDTRLVDWAPRSLENLEGMLRYDDAAHDFERRLAKAHVPPSYQGECPGVPPDLWMQLREAASLVRDRDWPAPKLVLLDGGANDVEIMNVPSPLSDVGIISARVLNLAGAMRELIVEIGRTWPQAIIAVAGYYPVFSKRSNLGGAGFQQWMKLSLASGHARFFGIPVPLASVSDALADNFLRDMQIKAEHFRDCFNRYLLPAEVRDANAELGASSNPRVVFCDPGFSPEEAMFAPGSVIWEPDVDGAPVDSVRLERNGGGSFHSAPCRGHNDIHHRASFGHPNVEGARRYADAIWSGIRHRVGVPAAEVGSVVATVLED